MSRVVGLGRDRESRPDAWITGSGGKSLDYNWFMTSIRVSAEFGIVVRRASLDQRNIEIDLVYQCMDTSSPLGLNDELISFGPSFGVEAQREFIRRLETIGLVYYEDFFDVKVDRPAWCEFLVALAS